MYCERPWFVWLFGDCPAVVHVISGLVVLNGFRRGYGFKVNSRPDPFNGNAWWREKPMRRQVIEMFVLYQQVVGP